MSNHQHDWFKVFMGIFFTMTLVVYGLLYLVMAKFDPSRTTEVVTFWIATMIVWGIVYIGQLVLPALFTSMWRKILTGKSRSTSTQNTN